MKKIVRLIFILIVFLSFKSLSKAYTVTAVQGYNMGSFSINRYEIDNASKGYAYCLSPKKYNYTYYRKKADVDPRKTKYELALVVAYTYLINNGAIEEADAEEPGAQDGGVISATFRLISEYYGKLSHTGDLGNSHIEPYLLSGINPKYPSYWSSGKAKTAKNIFQKAVNKVEQTCPGCNAKKKFEQLQKNGIIWKKEKAKFKASNISTSESKNWKTVEFTLGLADSKYKKMIDVINWSEFTKKSTNIKDGSVKCNNNGKCSAVVRKTAKSFKITGSITTTRNTINRMEIIEPTASVDTYQTFILVDSSPTKVNPTITINLTPNETHNPCTSEVVDGSTVYYGSDGIEVDDVEDYREQCVNSCKPINTTLNQYYCSNASNPDVDARVCTYQEYRKECEKPVCEFEPDPYTVNNRLYYGPNSEIYTQAQYQSSCIKKCQFDGITYYCSDNPEHDPDKNGRECSYEEYYRECVYCGKYEEFCTQNPTAVTSEINCDTYWLNCPNCNASVSVPSTCTDFNTDSNIKGTISDINKANTDCNHSVKPVKGCVIGGQDMARNSYQLTDQLKGNKFCKVYCYEDYSFTLPTAQHSTSGGYFNLQMSITGTRYCYLGSNNMVNSSNEYVSQAQFDYQNFLSQIRQSVYTTENKATEFNRKQDQLAQKQRELNNYKNQYQSQINNSLKNAKDIFNDNYKYCYEWQTVTNNNPYSPWDPQYYIWEQNNSNRENKICRNYWYGYDAAIRGLKNKYLGFNEYTSAKSAYNAAVNGYKGNSTVQKFDSLKTSFNNNNCINILSNSCRANYNEIDTLIDALINYEAKTTRLSELEKQFNEQCLNQFPSVCYDIRDELNDTRTFISYHNAVYEHYSENHYSSLINSFTRNCRSRYNSSQCNWQDYVTFANETLNSKKIADEKKIIIDNYEKEYNEALAELEADYNAKLAEDDRYNNALNSKTEYDNKIQNLQKEIDDLKKEITKTGDELVDLTKDVNDMVDDLRECTTLGGAWLNNMQFNPTITYEYNDYSGPGYSKGTMQKVGSETTNLENKYCYTSTNGRYECNNPVITTNQDVPTGTGTNYYRTSFRGWVKNSDGTYRDSISEISINLPTGIEKTVTKTATYAPSRSFNSYHQYGTVKTGDLCSGTGFNNCLWTRLPETALPVELKTGKGAFPFKLYVTNIGQYNSNNTLGRLVGNDNSVLNVYNKEVGNKCSVSDDGTKRNFETLVAEIGYVCGYINNCDECDVTCSGDSCDLTCDEDCKMKCKTCIYDGERNSFKYRTISLNNVFPNSCTTANCTTGQRKEGYNWDKTASTKAKVTLEEIEDAGDKVYETAEYSYTLTPSQMNEIRKYNKSVGTYANSTTPAGSPFNGQNALQCEQTTINGLTYSIRCLSTFLNDTSNTYFTTNKRNNSFTLWTESGYCPSGNCLSREDGIGPSWK